MAKKSTHETHRTRTSVHRMTSSISCYMLDGIQAYSMSVKVLGCPKLEKQRRWYMVVKGGRIFCSWVVLSSFVDALGNSLGCWYAGFNCYKVYVAVPGKIPLGYLHQTITGENMAFLYIRRQ